jgi:hypothetical protein
VGQDLVDQFITKHDFDGALEIMETIMPAAAPAVESWRTI